MREALQLLNQMQKDGVMESYAIGGAVAATYYLEPFTTMDLDILLSLTPLYEYLTSHGGRIQSEHVVFGTWPVQFLPASDPLELEALQEARTVDVDGTPTRVLQAEHLLALALRTGRLKDHNRILQFLSEKVIDSAKINTILERHGLQPKWHEFERRYLHG
jgi:hypothetical protein